jgi:serine/threonine protein kinase
MNEPGPVLLHYRIRERIGAGGMGTVYRAEDTLLHRPVAVKVLALRSGEDERTTRRFLREAIT